MRGLLTLVIAMGVLIVAGVLVIGVTLVHRLGAVAALPAAPGLTVLDQPTGTQIAGVAGLGSRTALTLRGGGPDRVVVLEAGRVVETIQLAH